MVLAALATVLLAAAPAAAQTPTPTSTPTPTATATPSPSPTPTATPTPEPTPVPPAPGDPMVAAVGDIACSPADPSFQDGAGSGRRCRMHATSDLVMNGGYTAALVLGDAQYEQGRYEEFLASYDRSWGRLLGITHPVAGNHEYFGDGAQGYFDYFNGPGNFTGRAGDRDKGYYSLDIGSWHLVAMNSVCSQIGGCGPGSPQHRWLQADLAAHQNQCTLVMWHHAPFTSSGPGWPSMRTFWQTLYDAGADVLLTGHAHNYERFAPLDPAGGIDPAHGIRQFVAGMGGKNLVSLPLTRPQTEARDATRFGILGLTLRPGSYDWRFVPASEGTFEDSGTSACHGPPPPARAAATTGPARASRTAAVLHAGIDAGRQPTSYRFQYGRGPRYGSVTKERTLAPGAGLQQVSVRLGRLKPGQRYHYRVVASNASGRSYGVRRTFTPGGTNRYASTVLRTRGLRAYWRLDDPGGGLVFDERARQLGWSSGSDWQPKPGALAGDKSLAADFDGAGRSAVVNGPSIGATGTLEGWFRWRAGTVLLRDDSATGGWLLGWDSRGRLGYRIAGRTYATERSVHAVRDGAWHHLALTKSGGRVDVFVDGRRVGGATDAPSTPSTSPWHIMRNGPLGQFATGSADEVAIYERALSAAEVRRHYEAGVARRQPNTAVEGPAGPTNDSTPLFESRSSERRSTFRCALSPPERRYPVFGVCPGRRGYGRLQDGTYTFAAYAVDADGHPDPDPVSRTFTVDTVVPQLTVGPVGQTLADVRRRGLRVGASCSESCTIVARMSVEGALARRVGGRRARRVEIARGTVAGAPGAATTVVVRLDRRARKRLERVRSLPVLLEVFGTDAAGNRRAFASRLTLNGTVAPPAPPTPPAPPAPAPTPAPTPAPAPEPPGDADPGAPAR